MIALSTSWKAGDFNGPAEFFKTLERFQPAGIELEYRIREPLFHQIRPSLKAAGIQVVSIHNFFPHPAGLPKRHPSGDLFSLAATDPEERQLAVRWTARTVETANDLQAGVVVLHGGYVDMEADIGTLKGYARQGKMETPTTREFLQARLETLRQKKGKHLDSLLSSLDRLVRIAERENVRLGLENRYHYHELPGFEDFETIFREFAGSPLGYWHDSGHAHAGEAFTFASQKEWLDAYGKHMVGVHLHDARGIDDHLPPGAGEIDFAGILPHIKDRIWVLELKPGTADSEVQKGLARVREMAAAAKIY